MSFKKDMKNLNIDINKFDENTGTITFKLSLNNIFDLNYPCVRIFQIVKNDVIFILERYDKYFRFIQCKPHSKTKICKIEIDEFIEAKKLFIGMTWTEEKNNLYIGAIPPKNSDALKSSSSTESNINFRIAKDGSIFQLGDENILIGNYLFCENNKIILQPTAKELLDFQLEKINIIISNCKIKEKGFLFETILIQQAIVMMATIFEVYLRERFYELCKERKINIDSLLELISKARRDEIKNDHPEISKKENKDIIEIFLLEENFINFQSWDRSKKAFNKIFNIKFGDLGLTNDELQKTQSILTYRHKIIHSSIDMTMLNIEEVPPAEPIFTNKEFGEKSFNIIKNFLLTFHENSLKI